MAEKRKENPVYPKKNKSPSSQFTHADQEKKQKPDYSSLPASTPIDLTLQTPTTPLGDSNLSTLDALVSLIPPETQYTLALKYENGIGVEKDFKKAADFLRLAVEQGFAKAQHHLGIYYEFGIAVEKNITEAILL